MLKGIFHLYYTEENLENGPCLKIHLIEFLPCAQCTSTSLRPSLVTSHYHSAKLFFHSGSVTVVSTDAPQCKLLQSPFHQLVITKQLRFQVHKETHWLNPLPEDWNLEHSLVIQRPLYWLRSIDEMKTYNKCDLLIQCQKIYMVQIQYLFLMIFFVRPLVRFSCFGFPCPQHIQRLHYQWLIQSFVQPVCLSWS